MKVVRATFEPWNSTKKNPTITGAQILRTDAGRALSKLQQIDRDRLFTLFRNAHAVIRNNRPLRDYEWVCKLYSAKGINVGQTYLNQKAALEFAKCEAAAERKKLKDYMCDVKFAAFLMDGSTGILGDEQEAVYLRLAKNGKVTEKFLGLGSPESTRSEDLKRFLLDMFDKHGVDKGNNEL